MAFSACLTLLLLLAVAPGYAAAPQAKAAPLHSPGSCWTFIPCFRGTGAGQQRSGDTGMSTRTTTLLSIWEDANTRANALLCTSTYVKRSMRLLISQGELHVQKSPLILRIDHNSAEAITKINLYLCGSLIYTEKEILNGFKFYISLHLCQSPHVFQNNHRHPLSTFRLCTGLEWDKISNYSRTVTLVSMQRQISVFNGVLEPLFLCVRQSRG